MGGGLVMVKKFQNPLGTFDLVDEFGLDQVRYFLMREVSFGKDGDFNRQSMINRINSDLANDLGNLAQRSLSMIYKNCDGAIPCPDALSLDDKTLLDMVDCLLVYVRDCIDKQAINKYLELIWKVVSAANVYFTAQEPWALKVTDPARMATVLYVTAESIRQISILSQPIMPDSAAKLLNTLNIPINERGFEYLGCAHRITSKNSIEKPQGVFPRFIEP